MVAVDYVLIPWWGPRVLQKMSCGRTVHRIAMHHQLLQGSDITSLGYSAAVLSLWAYMLTSGALMLSWHQKASWWKVQGDARLNKPFTKVAFHFRTLLVFCFCRIQAKLSFHWNSPRKTNCTCYYLIHISSLDYDHLISVLGYLIKHTDTYMPFSEINNYSENKKKCW